MSKPSLIRRLFGGIWRAITMVRNALANILFLVMLAVIYFVYLGGGPEPLPEKAALLLNPMGMVVDQAAPMDPLQTLLAEPSPASYEVELRDLIDAVELAREDDSINALVMELDYLVAIGISRTRELVPALEAFRATGKPIVAVGDYYSQDQYLLASYADEVIGHPMGGVAIEGYGMFLQYYAEALEKLSITMHVFKGGEFKSATEPLTRMNMSPAEKELALRWLNDLWAHYTAAVEANRQLPPGALDAYVNGYARRLVEGDGDAASDARDAGLIDRLLSRIDANEYLVELIGAADDEGRYQSVPFEQYLARNRAFALAPQTGDTVAVITAQGNMLPGEQPPGTIGADTLARQISAAVNSDTIKAIVLRVTTPGGSLFASEVIHEQMLQARAAGKPVVVSMGSMAASGGYYIATAADEIWATPTTITGSIGVFAAFPTIENLLQRGGIRTDGVGTTELAGSLRLDRGLNPQLGASLQAGVKHAYRHFTDLVAQSRDLTAEEVNAAAEGRVWSATDALALGLVDHLGGLSDAVEAAAARAELTSYEVDYIEEPPTPGALFLQQLTQRMGHTGLLHNSAELSSILALSRPLINAQQLISELQDPRHLYARCLGCPAAL